MLLYLQDPLDIYGFNYHQKKSCIPKHYRNALFKNKTLVQYPDGVYRALLSNTAKWIQMASSASSCVIWNLSEGISFFNLAVSGSRYW